VSDPEARGIYKIRIMKNIIVVLLLVAAVFRVEAQLGVHYDPTVQPTSVFNISSLWGTSLWVTTFLFITMASITYTGCWIRRIMRRWGDWAAISGR